LVHTQFLFMSPRPSRSTLFPYTTLFRSYLKASGDEDFVQGLYETMIQPMANFIDSYIDSATKLPHASYDLWEEKFLTSTYTTGLDRKSTRLNSSHVKISYAVFCLKKKKR